MAVPDRYPLKDVEGVPEGVRLSFGKKLKPELICCTCDAVTPKGLKDGKGHSFCQACVDVQTDDCNLFTCALCGCQAYVMDMPSNENEWDILKKMITACPNAGKTCQFKGALEDVLRHYKTCGCQGKVMCSFCHCLQDRKTLVDHMKDDCPRRVLDCCFCHGDVEACHKLKHESSCRQRPATCQHCRRNFRTVAELEDEHYQQCPQVPVHCAFKALGCEFYASRQEVTLHEATVKHTEILVQEVCRLKEANKRLTEDKKRLEERIESLEEKQERHDLTEDVKRLEQKLQNLEDKQNEEAFIRLNIEASTEYHDEEIKVLRRQVEAPRKEPELEKRLAKLEETSGAYQKPFEKLMENIAGLK